MQKYIRFLALLANKEVVFHRPDRQTDIIRAADGVLTRKITFFTIIHFLFSVTSPYMRAGNKSKYLIEQQYW